MASIQTPITDLDDLLITLSSVQGVAVSLADTGLNGTWADDIGNNRANPTYTGTGTDFVAAGFQAGDSVVISGSTESANDSAADTSVVLANVTATVLTFVSGTVITSASSQDATFTKVANDINVATEDADEIHGLAGADVVVQVGTITTATTATVIESTAAGFNSNFDVGDDVVISDGENRGVIAQVDAVTANDITFVADGSGPLVAGDNNDASGDNFVIQKVRFATLTSPAWAGTGYTGRYLVKSVADSENLKLHAFGNAAPLNAVGQSGAATNTTAETAVGELMTDNNQGVFQTPEVVIDAPNKTIQLRNATDSDLETLGSGVVGQALYSFMKERWKEVEGLTRFDFPMLSITNEQFEFINGYVPLDDTTRKMIRTAGWAERGADNIIRREYSGIITLGSLGDTDQPYFVQENEPDSPIFNTDFTGPVNEAVKNYQSLTASDIFTTAGSPGTINSTTTDLSGFEAGNVILIGGAGAGANATDSFRVTEVVNAQQLEVEPVTGGDALATVGAGTHTLTFDAQQTFKIFVRERGKLYADADLADIGVTDMTYIVYRFPVSNAADLNIQSTSDNAITGGNIGSLVVAGNTMTFTSIQQDYADAADAFEMNATTNTITSNVADAFAKFTIGHTVSLSAVAGSAVDVGNVSDNFGDYIIADIEEDTPSAGIDTLSLSGRNISVTQSIDGGTFELFEPHGLYAGAPIHFDAAGTPANAESSYTVAAVENVRKFTVNNDNSVADGTTTYTTPVASAGLSYIRFQGGGTYVSLEFIADTLDPTNVGTLETGTLKIWEEPYDSFGTQQSGQTVDTVVADGTITITAGGGDFDSFLVGQYIALNGTGDNDDKYVVISKSSSTLVVGNIETGAVGLVGTDESGATATISTYFGQHHVVQSSDNGKWYRQRTAVTPATITEGVSTVDPVVDIGSDTDTTINWGTNLDDDYEGAYTVETGQGATDSAYTIVLDGNTEANTPTITKEVAYEYSQWALRQTSAVDTATVAVGGGELNDTLGRRIGKIADILVTFVGSTLVTSQGVFVEDINSLDINNIEFTDFEGVSHVFPIEVQVNINFNDNLTADDDAVFYAYYTSLSEVGTEFEYGKNDAVQVNEIEAGVVTKVGSDISNLVTNVVGGVYTFNYAFDSDTANIPNGTAGRIGGADQGITVVAIGLETGQYVKASGTITSNGLTLSLVAPLERNYTDPVV